MTNAVMLIDHIPITRPHRDYLYLLLTILRWMTCDHKGTYWANGVDGYVCPICDRNGYSGSPFYDPNKRSF